MTFHEDESAGALLKAREPAGGRKVMFQAWRRLLFLHWKCEPGALQETLPDGLEVDTFGGEAYIGIVPFFMCDVRPRFLPPFPGLSNFLELNVRTYVRPKGGGPPGVWFFSLDANCRPAVWVARKFFHLPYFHAAMHAEVDRETGWIDYRSRRRGEGEDESRFRYRAVESSAPREAEPGSLEFFLLERYWLFAHDVRKNRILKGQVQHRPYRYREAEVETFDPMPATRLGLGIGNKDQPVHRCVAEDVDVEIYGVSPLLMPS